MCAWVRISHSRYLDISTQYGYLALYPHHTDILLYRRGPLHVMTHAVLLSSRVGIMETITHNTHLHTNHQTLGTIVGIRNLIGTAAEKSKPQCSKTFLIPAFEYNKAVIIVANIHLLTNG